MSWGVEVGSSVGTTPGVAVAGAASVGAGPVVPEADGRGAGVPSEPVDWVVEAVLTGLAALVVAAAWFSYRGRDIG